MDRKEGASAERLVTMALGELDLVERAVRIEVAAGGVHPVPIDVGAVDQPADGDLAFKLEVSPHIREPNDSS